MAVIGTPKRDRIGPSFKGLLYSYKRGDQWVASAYPVKRSSKITPDEARERRRFKAVCEALKRINGPTLYYARTNAWSTPMLPRDALMAMLYGKGPILQPPIGPWIRPMAARVDISMLLDNIAWKPGSVMFRDASLWKGLDIGLEGQVLTVNGETGAPEWRDAQGGGQGGWVMPAAGGINSSQQGACIGSVILPFVDMEMARVAVWHQFGATQDIRLCIARCNAAGVVQAIMSTFKIDVVQDGTTRWSMIPLPVPVPVLSGQYYAILFCNTAGWVGTNVYIGRTGSIRPQVPVDHGVRSARKYAYPVMIGDDIGFDAEPYSIGYQVA